MKYLFFISLFFYSLIWIIVIPIWHFPDEQAHFAQIAFVERNSRNYYSWENTLTNEIYQSEKLLGTDRDTAGNNLFTFHPEYKIQYSKSPIGIHEREISNLNTEADKARFVRQESSNYPLLYYTTSALVYRLFYDSDLFVRVFAIRLLSISLFLLGVYFSYRIAVLFFKNKFTGLLAAALIGFHPMVIFSNIGINSDVLGNLFFTSFILICMRVLTKKNISLDIILGFANVLVLTYIKPQFIVAFPLWLALLWYRSFTVNHGYRKLLLCIFIPVACMLSLYVSILKDIGPARLFPQILQSFFVGHGPRFFYEYIIPHTVREVLPWYWGVYKWLGLTYSRFIHRIINRIVFLSLLGICIWIVRNLKKNREFKFVIFFIISNIIYFLSISLFDWYSWYRSTYVLGVQGRYFFPLISTQMILLLLGWGSLVPGKLKKLMSLLLVVMMIALGFYALYVLVGSYYTASGILNLTIQLSQYKPFFLKQNMIILIGSTAVVSLVWFLLLLLRSSMIRDNKKI